MECIIARSVRWAGLTPFLFDSSWLMKLSHDSHVDMRTSSNYDNIAGLSESWTSQRAGRKIYLEVEARCDVLMLTTAVYRKAGPTLAPRRE